MLLGRSRWPGSAGQPSPVGPHSPCSGAGSRGCPSTVYTNSATHAEGDTEEPRGARPQALSPDAAWEPQPCCVPQQRAPWLSWHAPAAEVCAGTSALLKGERQRLLQVLRQTLVSNAPKPLPSPLPEAAHAAPLFSRCPDLSGGEGPPVPICGKSHSTASAALVFTHL